MNQQVGCVTFSEPTTSQWKALVRAAAAGRFDLKNLGKGGGGGGLGGIGPTFAEDADSRTGGSGAILQGEGKS